MTGRNVFRQTSADPAPARRRRWPRILFWSAASLLILLPLIAGAALVWLRWAAMAALPALDGDLPVAGLSAPVTVRRDAHGVPHIDAATEADLFLAQGYVTAQDRLWQMDSFRRNSEGELAEVLGHSLLKHDETQRVLQIAPAAKRIYEHLSAQDRSCVDSYARGVNLFIDAHQNSLPPEFRLLDYRPKPWTGADTISVGLMMVQELDMHAVAKLGRSHIEARLGNPKLESDLYPVGSWRDHPPTGTDVDWNAPQPQPPASQNEDDEDEPTKTQLAPFSGTPQTAKALLALLGLPTCDGCAAGSNNWVVAGSHTASGKPLLSNDMHLGLSVPSIWYMADLRAPGFHCAGVTLPGFPFVIAGHNEHLAWGFTALMADVQDLYVEKLDGKGNYQAADGNWKPLGLDHEVIRVRGGEDVTLDVRSTDHGPIVNPILSDESRTLALKWNLYDPALNVIPLYQMNRASNWAEFSQALAAWNWPAQNLVYSDDQGHIAYQAVGRVPLRPAGLMPVPITDNKHEWQGYIPFEDMPHAFDPPSGFLATANSRVTTPQPPYPLTLEWIDPYRAERIYKLLNGRDGLTPKDMLQTQTDIYSELDQEMGQRFAYAIDHTDGPAGNGDPRLRKAADLMRSWDGRLATDSAAASIETRARAELRPMILGPKLGKEMGDYHWGESTFAEEEIVMHAMPDWLPPAYKNWDALLTAAVRKGIDDGKAPADLATWRYGSWHIIDLEHPLAQFLPFLGHIAGTGPQPMNGDVTTVEQIGRDVAPSQRFTMDWSNVDGSTENIVLGESGNPLSPYFKDQWNDWYHGTTFALPFTPAAVAAQTRHTLRLTP
ncbi:MAG TPA: penicillin acylase family protein [Terracidiphilus sp.]|jgi:penicillin amidase